MSRLGTILNALVNRTGVSSTEVTSTYGTLYLFKDNSTKTVRAYGYARSGSNMTTSTILFTVPSGYRPSETKYFPIVGTTDTQYTAAYYGIVDSDGNVKQNLGGSAREVFIATEWEI